MLSLNYTLGLQVQNRGVLTWSPKPIHETEWILKLSLTSTRISVIQAIGNFRRNLKVEQQLVIIHTRFDGLKQEHLPLLRDTLQPEA